MGKEFVKIFEIERMRVGVSSLGKGRCDNWNFVDSSVLVVVFIF